MWSRGLIGIVRIGVDLCGRAVCVCKQSVQDALGGHTKATPWIHPGDPRQCNEIPYGQRVLHNPNMASGCHRHKPRSSRILWTWDASGFAECVHCHIASCMDSAGPVRTRKVPISVGQENMCSIFSTQNQRSDWRRTGMLCALLIHDWTLSDLQS